MAVTIQIKRKSGSNPSSLAAGELALRTDTGELFSYDGASIIKIGSKNMLTTAGGTLTGFLTLHANPSSDMHAATKSYVDSVAAGLDVLPSVRAATTVNITLSGTQTIDGVSLSVGDRVLVKNQSTTTQNGIYVVASGAWSYASDWATGKVSFGAFTFVELGSTNKGTGWVATSPEGKSGGITVGTDQIAFNQFNAGTPYTAGNGINISGNIISAKSGDTTISVDSSGIKVATIGTNQLAGTCVTAAKLGSDVAGTGLTGGNGSAIAANFGTTSGTICQGNDSRLHNQNTDVGTSSSTFYLGGTGVKLKNDIGSLAVRDNADSLYAAVKAVTYRVHNNSNAYAALITGTVTADRTLTVPDLTGTLLTDNSTIDGGTW